MQQLNALHRHVTFTHPVIILMTRTGNDIDWVLPIAEEQCQYL